MYDVIIIGAGPCGCIAARTLSKNGLKVLIIEKCKLPRYKSCSGILIDKSIRFIEQYCGCAVPAAVACTPADNMGMVFTDDKGQEYCFKSRGLNIWRDKFDYWLLSLAGNEGAEIIDGCAVTSVHKDSNAVSVLADGVTRQARYVIDCSGAVGVAEKARQSIVTYQTYNRGTVELDPHYFYAYLQPELSGYDAWFNVKDGMLVIGVASAESKRLKAYHERFIAYLKEKHDLCITEQVKTDKWLIRNIEPPFDIDCGNGRILKAGENAGFLNPMGEGISCAMESGYYAALAVVNNFDNTSRAVEEYKLGAVGIREYMRRQWQLVGRMSNRFSFMCR